MTWLLGPLLGQIPIASLQLAIGILLLLFGMGWLRKASLRTEGVVPVHDEEAIFAAERARLGTPQHRVRRSLQWVAGITALKAVLLEGLIRLHRHRCRRWREAAHAGGSRGCRRGGMLDGFYQS